MIRHWHLQAAIIRSALFNDNKGLSTGPWTLTWFVILDALVIIVRRSIIGCTHTWNLSLSFSLSRGNIDIRKNRGKNNARHTFFHWLRFGTLRSNHKNCVVGSCSRIRFIFLKTYRRHRTACPKFFRLEFSLVDTNNRKSLFVQV